MLLLQLNMRTQMKTGTEISTAPSMNIEGT